VAGWSDAPESEHAQQEAENSLQQARLVDETIAEVFSGSGGWKLEVGLILRLHAISVENIEDFGGKYREIDTERPIVGSQHRPPNASEVPALVEAMCEHLNAVDVVDAGILYRAAYALWRLNWIHPFEDGNGRTSRALGYMLLRIDANLPWPLGRSLPERIWSERIKYYRCLEAADREEKKLRRGRLKLQELQHFIERLLKTQLQAMSANPSGPLR
jgi:Fic family protein